MATILSGPTENIRNFSFKMFIIKKVTFLLRIFFIIKKKMAKNDASSIAMIIFFSVMLAGILLGISAKPLFGDEDFSITKVGNICSFENIQGQISCQSVMLGIGILLLVLGIVEIMELKSLTGKDDLGWVTLVSGFVIGFMISFLI